MPIARVRAVSETDPPTFGAGIGELWSELAELGAAGVLVPEQYGGSGLGLLDASLIAQELGRAVTPSPFLATVPAGDLLQLAIRPVMMPGRQRDRMRAGCPSCDPEPC